MTLIDPRKIPLAPRPVGINCPMCGKTLGGIVITDPDLLTKTGVPLIELTVTCATGLAHSGLTLRPISQRELDERNAAAATAGQAAVAPSVAEGAIAKAN